MFELLLLVFEDDNLRISLQEVFCKKGVLINFEKFAGKHLCQSLFYLKLKSVQFY